MEGKEIIAIERKVAKGVKWLDKNIGRAKWSKKIKANHLNLGSSMTCVIGEVLGDYNELNEQYSIGDEEADSMGFVINNPLSEEYNVQVRLQRYAILTAVWMGTLKVLGIRK